ncbi:MAG: HAD family phosphatase [Clostridium sp.]|nr:HAD family phosphatase [Clostridium sp.]
MIKTVIFDMDGVLIDTERIYDEAWNIILKERDISNIDFVISGCRGRTAEDSKKFLDKIFEGRFTGEELISALMERFSEIVEERGLPIKKGTYEILKYLKENNFEIGLASSTKKSLVISHLKKAGIIDYFSEITAGDMVKKGKPAPDIYLMACEKFNRKPSECIAIEDSINGVNAALNAGMNTIMVPDIVQPTEDLAKRVFKKCNSLLEVEEFLKTLQK